MVNPKIVAVVSKKDYDRLCQVNHDPETYQMSPEMRYRDQVLGCHFRGLLTPLVFEGDPRFVFYKEYGQKDGKVIQPLEQFSKEHELAIASGKEIREQGSDVWREMADDDWWYVEDSEAYCWWDNIFHIGTYHVDPQEFLEQCLGMKPPKNLRMWSENPKEQEHYFRTYPFDKYTRCGIIDPKCRPPNIVRISPSGGDLEQVYREFEDLVTLHVQHVGPVGLLKRRFAPTTVKLRTTDKVSSLTKKIVDGVNKLSDEAKKSSSEVVCGVTYDSRKGLATAHIGLRASEFQGITQVKVINKVEEFSVGQEPAEMVVLGYMGAVKGRCQPAVEHSYGGWRLLSPEDDSGF